MRKFLLQEMTWPEAKERMTDAVVILPIGSTEQHGHHLPVGTDAMIGYEILKRALEPMSDDYNVVVLPPISIGLSQEHLDFPGTISIMKAASLISEVEDILESAINHGARKILIWNSHGGNTASLMAAAREIRRETGAFVVLTSWFELGLQRLPHGTLESESLIHSDEGETSVMLHLFPDLVKMEKAQKELPEKLTRLPFFRKFDKPYIAWLTKDISSSGVIGDPTKASKEKGEKFAQAAIDGLSDFIKDLSSMKL
jgi:creatinine amidohydrolase